MMTLPGWPGHYLDKIWSAQSIKQFLDEFVLTTTEGNVVSVSELIDIEHRVAAMGAFVGAHGCLPSPEYRANNIRGCIEYRLKHADIYIISLARGMPFIQRHHDAAKREMG